MERVIRGLPIVLLAGGLLLASCGGDGAESAIPTAEQLASSLVVVGDYPGEWTVNTPPDASEAGASGVITDEERAMLPQLELCPAASAESQAVAGSVRWMAFRQLDLSVDDPIEPPDDMTGHMVFAQEFLSSADPAEIEATFGLLRDGLKACLGDIPAEEEGPGQATEMPIPGVGDDRYGVLLTIEEAGGGAQWMLHNAVVRKGAVLALIQVIDIRAGDGVEPLFTVDDIGAIIQTAVDKL